MTKLDQPRERALLEALADLEAPALPRPSARQRLLTAIASPGRRLAPLYGALGQLFDWGDAELEALFARAEEPSAWAASQVQGVMLLHLAGGPRVAGADNGLVRLAPSTTFPLHRHLGPERVLVLSGGYRDDQSGQLYRSGDWHEMPVGSSHSYTSIAEGETWLAVSVVEGVHVDGLGTLSPGRD